VYQTGWPTVGNLVEDADNDFFNRVLYIMKIMFYIRCYPNETTWLGPLNCNADAMNVGYSYVQRCQTQFYIQTIIA